MFYDLFRQYLSHLFKLIMIKIQFKFTLLNNRNKFILIHEIKIEVL